MTDKAKIALRTVESAVKENAIHRWDKMSRELIEQVELTMQKRLDPMIECRSDDEAAEILAVKYSLNKETVAGMLSAMKLMQMDMYRRVLKETRQAIADCCNQQK